MAMEGEEPMSELQKSLLRRLNTMQKPDRQAAPPKRGTVGPGAPPRSQGTASPGAPPRSQGSVGPGAPPRIQGNASPGAPPRSQRGAGPGALPRSQGNNPTTRNKGTVPPPRGQTGGPGAPPRSTTLTKTQENVTSRPSPNIHDSSSTTHPSPAGQAPPPPTDHPRRSHKTAPDDRGGVSEASAANRIAGGSMKRKAAELAAKLGMAPSEETAPPQHKATPPQRTATQSVPPSSTRDVAPGRKSKPARLEKSTVVTATASKPPPLAREEGEGEGEGEGDPIYMNIGKGLRDSIGSANNGKDIAEDQTTGPDDIEGPPLPHRMVEDEDLHQPRPPADSRPPQAPKRTNSVRKPSVPAVVRSGEVGVSSGYNSGASGDGIVRGIHKKGSKHGAIAPMGSSSESDYSGDGRVQRNRLKERSRHHLGDQQPPPQHQPPPPPQHPPPQHPAPQPPHVDVPPPLPLSMPPSRKTPQPQIPPPVPQMLPPQLPPPRMQEPGPPLLHGSPYRRSPNSSSPKRSTSHSKLPEFLATSASSLPVRVTVKEDLSAISSDGRLAASETLNLHFLRNVKVAIVRDMTTEETFSIPYNSNVKLGLIYQPSPYDESASPYMQLKSAADVMKLKQLPLVVTATTSYDGGAVDRSVSEGEVLFVRGTVKGSGIAKGKQLQVVNFLGVEKQLSSKCTGSFSTDPRHMKLHLSALLQRDIEWPQYVILYPDKEVGKRLPASMSNTPVLLEELKRETSVIATSEFEGDIIYDISAKLDVTVETVDLAEPVRRGLRQMTGDLYDNFVASECQVIMAGRSPTSFDLQCLLYRKLLDHVTEGIHLHLPSPGMPVPGIFDLRASGSVAEGNSDDSASIASTKEEGMRERRQQLLATASARQADTLSVSSGKIPPSIGNASDSEIEEEEEPEADDEDEEQAIYEDIEDIRDNIEDARENIRKEVETGTTASEGPKGKKKSFLKYLKIKTKTKKGKEKGPVSGGGHDLEFHEEDEDADVVGGGGGGGGGEGVRGGGGSEPIPTESHSSNESYDEMGPGNAGYISDNYEDVGFDEAAVKSIDADEPPSPLPPPPAQVSQSKGKMLQRATIQKSPAMSLAQAMASTTDDLGAMKDKKKKIKDGSKSATLPRKMKLVSDKKVKIPLPMPEGTEDKPVETVMMPDIELSGQVWALRNEMERLKGQVQELAATVEILKGQNSALCGGGGGGWGSGMSEGGPSLREAQGEEEKEANMRALKAMTLEQVLGILDSMEMRQYKAVFSRQQVTGLLLAMVDDDILKDDLEVASKLHRARLMKVASGQLGVAASWAGKDSKYVKFGR